VGIGIGAMGMRRGGVMAKTRAEGEIGHVKNKNKKEKEKEELGKS